jgi:hypothetical protein
VTCCPGPDALRRLEPTAEITALGTVRGLDTTLIPARGYPLELIPPAPLPRRLNQVLLQTPGRLRDLIWIQTALIPVLTDPERIPAMSAHASTAGGAPDADIVLARRVLTAVAERRRFAL